MLHANICLSKISSVTWRNLIEQRPVGSTRVQCDHSKYFTVRRREGNEELILYCHKFVASFGNNHVRMF